MVKILGISASPRNQATCYAVEQALESARQFPGVETEHISFKDKKILPCTHCDACMGERASCVLNDDMEEMLEAFLKADGYVIGTPVYSYNPTPEIIMFFNRMRPWRNRFPHSVMEGKVGGAIAVGGTRNGGQEMTINAILNMYLAREILVVGGSSGNYTGGKIWTNNRDREGAEADEVGMLTARDIGCRVAKAALMLKGEWHVQR